MQIVISLLMLVLISSLSVCQTISEIHKITRNGIALHVEQHYNDDSDILKSNILLVHGLTYSSHEFNVDYKDYSLVDFLVKNGYSVWLLDITGYGQSEVIEDGFKINSNYASEDILITLKYIIDHTDDPRIDLLGWSWGTVTASLAASRKPKWIEGLILYAPLLSGYDGAPPSEPWHTNSWQHAAGDFQKTGKGEVDSTIVENIVVAEFLSNAWRYDRERSPNGGRRDLMTGRNNPLIDLNNVKIPILFIAGTKDPYVYWDKMESALDQLRKNNQNVQLVKIEGGSHILMLEKLYYKRFQREILNFLRITGE